MIQIIFLAFLIASLALFAKAVHKENYAQVALGASLTALVVMLLPVVGIST